MPFDPGTIFEFKKKIQTHYLQGNNSSRFFSKNSSKGLPGNMNVFSRIWLLTGIVKTQQWILYPIPSHPIPVQCYCHSTHQSMHCTLHFMVFCNCQPTTVSLLILYWLLYLTWAMEVCHVPNNTCDFLVIHCPL